MLALVVRPARGLSSGVRFNFTLSRDSPTLSLFTALRMPMQRHRRRMRFPELDGLLLYLRLPARLRFKLTISLCRPYLHGFPG